VLSYKEAQRQPYLYLL